MTVPHQPPPPPAAITATGLRKAFGEKTVLDGIDLHIPKGSVFSLLGPNGAGKTTAVQILSTLVTPDAGEVRVAGHDVVREPGAVRAAIGVTGQFSAVDNLLTGEENLLLMAELHGYRRRPARHLAAGLAERFDLVEAAKRPASTYSGGMRRRLDIAMTLVGDPSVIFLDEPTTGLDPRSRHGMWEIVRELVGDGVTVFLTTQYLEEADQLADRIAVLNGGKLVAEGAPEELKRLVPGGHVVLRFADAAGLDRAARALGIGTADSEALTLQVPGDGSVHSVKALLDWVEATEAEVEGLTIDTPDLDDVFFAVTGRPDNEKATIR
ncbi:ATP-binding cassette domain-containing protein [Streptomyces sp. G44]|uniref:ATP-binding cassette domain-containing protein n=1 Tax=Streptomyces sp. G44 TaxID=2807632 RepID=UPI001960EC7F|nr:ATP-binding cassette domain-containing protein [Streptomyces sp. G44]MBM7170483.1 ATP-binding cassette domain-containing protein [Streptomyces sp. G44]